MDRHTDNHRTQSRHTDTPLHTRRSGRSPPTPAATGRARWAPTEIKEVATGLRALGAAAPSPRVQPLPSPTLALTLHSLLSLVPSPHLFPLPASVPHFSLPFSDQALPPQAPVPLSGGGGNSSPWSHLPPERKCLGLKRQSPKELAMARAALRDRTNPPDLQLGPSSASHCPRRTWASY